MRAVGAHARSVGAGEGAHMRSKQSIPVLEIVSDGVRATAVPHSVPHGIARKITWEPALSPYFFSPAARICSVLRTRGSGSKSHHRTEVKRRVKGG